MVNIGGCRLEAGLPGVDEAFEEFQNEFRDYFLYSRSTEEGYRRCSEGG